MIAIGPNFFYTVTLPCTLWFLDRGKRGTPREDTVLFLDARHIFRQVDRAHRDFLPEQIELLANIVRLYRGEEPETVAGSAELDGRALPGRRLRRRARASARSRRSPRSRRRAGASTPAATSAWPRARRTTATSTSGSPSCTTSSRRCRTRRRCCGGRSTLRCGGFSGRECWPIGQLIAYEIGGGWGQETPHRRPSTSPPP